MKSGTWRVTLGYRRLTASEWVVGHEVKNASGPGGQPLDLAIHSVDLSVSYAPVPRLALSLNLPVSDGRAGRIYPDGKWHEAQARGLGDANLMANYWFRDPANAPRGNFAVGLGVKAGTGRHDAIDDFYLANGSAVSFPVDDTIQPGDGTWGAIFQIQGFQRISDRLFAYGSGAYTANPTVIRDETRQPTGPLSTEHFSVPDVFGVRAGVALTTGTGRGPWWMGPGKGSMSFSLGWRFDGTLRKDLFGGPDPGFRRPALVGYVDPGVGLTRGRHSFTASVPFRVYKRFRPSYLDIEKGRQGGGDLAQYLVFLSYGVAF